MLKTLNLAHSPPELAVHVALYADLENASFLKDQLLAGNPEFEYSFIDARMVLSTTHVLAATFRAMNDFMSERLKSRNIHSEIVFCFSPNNNIGEAFRKFGISESTKDLIVVKVSTVPNVTRESVEAHLRDVLLGTPVSFEDSSFMDISDLPKIAKAYKLPSPQQAKGKPTKASSMNSESSTTREGRHQLEVSVLGLMALRGAS